MTEKQIITKFTEYFDMQEVVGERVFKKYGDRCIRFFDIRLLETMVILREGINKPIFCNNWAYPERTTRRQEQRGLRTNVQPLVKDKTFRNQLYVSPHIQGKGLDFDVQGMSADSVRLWIMTNGFKFPYKIRLERGVSWVHLDIVYEEKNNKIYLFNP